MKKENLIKALQKGIDAEASVGYCYRHLTELIRNGVVKSQFSVFAQEAEKNKEALCEKLALLGVKGYKLKKACSVCNLQSDSFSLEGTLNLCLETTNAAYKFYKEIISFCEKKEDKAFFKKLMQQKGKVRAMLKKEKAFSVHVAEDHLIANCMPKLMRKLWP